jgi:hypothetical protein
MVDDVPTRFPVNALSFPVVTTTSVPVKLVVAVVGGDMVVTSLFPVVSVVGSVTTPLTSRSPVTVRVPTSVRATDTSAGLDPSESEMTPPCEIEYRATLSELTMPIMLVSVTNALREVTVPQAKEPVESRRTNSPGVSKGVPPEKTVALMGPVTSPLKLGMQPVSIGQSGGGVEVAHDTSSGPAQCVLMPRMV